MTKDRDHYHYFSSKNNGTWVWTHCASGIVGLLLVVLTEGPAQIIGLGLIAGVTLSYVIVQVLEHFD